MLTLLLAAGMTHAQFVNQAAEVPAFHPAPPKAGTTLPPVLTQKQLADQGMIAPAQVAAYKAAAKAGPVLYQMPCYCYCDRNQATRACAAALRVRMAPIAALACRNRFILIASPRKAGRPR